ncbi:hypothetical protein GCM10020258_51270 [Sphingomonas yabuuchiae]
MDPASQQRSLVGQKAMQNGPFLLTLDRNKPVPRKDRLRIGAQRDKASPFRIFANHDDHQIGSFNRRVSQGRRLNTISDPDRLGPGGKHLMPLELRREEEEEPLRRVASGPATR